MPERSDRQCEREHAKRKTEAGAKRAEELSHARAYAKRILALFNARAARGRRPAFFPTIKCALVAETPMVLSVCPACRVITETDLRKLDHRDHCLDHPQGNVPEADSWKAIPRGAPFRVRSNA